MEESMLTTIDNPYNPFTQYDEWYAFDRLMGYHTPEYLARVAIVSDGLSPADQSLSIENAIAEIVAYNFSGKHCRVTKSNFDEVITKRLKNKDEQKAKSKD